MESPTLPTLKSAFSDMNETDSSTISTELPLKCKRCKAMMSFNYMFCTSCGQQLKEISAITDSSSSLSQRSIDSLKNSFGKKTFPANKTKSKKVKSFRDTVIMNDSTIPKEVLVALTAPLKPFNNEEEEKCLMETYHVVNSMELANAELIETMYNKIAIEKTAHLIHKGKQDRELIIEDVKVSYERKSDYMSDSIAPVIVNYEKTYLSSSHCPSPEVIPKEPSISYESLAKGPEEEPHAWLWGDIFNRSNVALPPGSPMKAAASNTSTILSRASERSRLTADHSQGNIMFWGTLMQQGVDDDAKEVETEVKTGVVEKVGDDDEQPKTLSEEDIPTNNTNPLQPAKQEESEDTKSVHFAEELETNHYAIELTESMQQLSHQLNSLQASIIPNDPAQQTQSTVTTNEVDLASTEVDDKDKISEEERILMSESEDEILSRKCNTNLKMTNLFSQACKRIKETLPHFDRLIRLRDEISHVDRERIEELIEEEEKARLVLDYCQTELLSSLQKTMSYFHRRANLQRTIIASQIANLLMKITQLETYFRDEYDQAKRNYMEYLSQNPLQFQQYQRNPTLTSEEMEEVQEKATTVVGDLSLQLKMLMSKEMELTGSIK